MGGERRWGGERRVGKREEGWEERVVGKGRGSGEWSKEYRGVRGVGRRLRRQEEGEGRGGRVIWWMREKEQNI